MLHAEHQSRLPGFLRQRITCHRNHTIPFHLPSTKVFYRKHPSVSTILANGDAFTALGHPNPATVHVPILLPSSPRTCVSRTCSHSRLCPVSDQRFLRFSGKSTAMPPTETLKTSYVQAIQPWHRRARLPIPATDELHVQQLLQHQINAHKKQTTDIITNKKVFAVR